MELSLLNIERTDLVRLERFYRAASGRGVAYSEGMVEGHRIMIGFGKLEGLRPAQGSDEAGGVKGFQLDLQVDDLRNATETLYAIGARQPDFLSRSRKLEGVDRSRRSAVLAVTPHSVATP